MSITCQVCNKEFAGGLITPTHLKKHSITALEYKARYGALYTEEYSAQRAIAISRGKTGKPASNRGVAMGEDQKKELSRLAKERFANGQQHPMQGKHHSEETKTKLREASLLQAGTEMAKTMRKDKKKEFDDEILSKIERAGLEIVNPAFDDILHLRCTICKEDFHRTRQRFTDSKFRLTMCPTCFPANSGKIR